MINDHTNMIRYNDWKSSSHYTVAAEWVVIIDQIWFRDIIISNAVRLLKY